MRPTDFLFLRNSCNSCSSSRVLSRSPTARMHAIKRFELSPNLKLFYLINIEYSNPHLNKFIKVQFKMPPSHRSGDFIRHNVMNNPGNDAGPDCVMIRAKF